MGVILDTSIWVDVERGRLAPGDVAAVTGDDPVYLAPPVIAELQYGVQRAPNAAARNRRASALARIRRKPCLIIDRETGEFFAGWRPMWTRGANPRRTGSTISGWLPWQSSTG